MGKLAKTKICEDCGIEFEPNNHLGILCPKCQRFSKINYKFKQKFTRICKCGRPTNNYRCDEC